MMMLPQINRERVVTWALGIGLFIFLLTCVAMPVLNDALNNFNPNVTKSIAYAQSQQYIKIPLDPSYTETIGPRGSDFLLVMDNFNFTKIISATVNFNVFVKADTTFYAFIDGRVCLSPKFFVQGGSSQQVSFDCSNILTGIGKYIVTVYADNPVPSAFGLAEVSYFLPPIDICAAVPDVKSSVTMALVDYRQIAPASLHFSGTDYFSGEVATVFVQLVDANSAAVNNASCEFDMYNATNPLLTPVYSKQPMIFRGDDGIYYYQFSLLGMPSGTYPLDAKCTYVYDNYYFYPANSIQQINITVTTGTFTGGSAFDLNSYADGLYAEVTGVNHNITYTWNNVTGNTTQIDMIWVGELSAVRTQKFLAFNWTGDSWYLLGSIVTTGQGGAGGAIPTGLDDMFTAGLPDSIDFRNGTQVKIQTQFTGSACAEKVNWLTLKTYINSSYVTDVKGSSEIHIYPDIVSNIWNFTNRTLTSIDFTTVTSRLDQMNGTINSILSLSQSINLTVNQTLALVQAMNLTTVQTLQLLQIMNLTQAQIQQTVNQINLSINDVVTFVNNTNFTVNQILAISQAINLTAVQTLAVAVDVNLTSAQVFALLQGLNVSSLGYLGEINATVNNNALSLQQILGLANQTNLTTQQILSLLQQINTTFEIKLDNLNDSAGLLLNLSGEINATTHEVNVTVYQILAVVQGINITALQTYQLLQAMNLTQWQIWNILLGMNTSISQILNFSNLTYINTNDILFLSIQTNSTVSQILGIVQGLNISLNQSISGNITLSTNLTSQTLNDISEKVWLQFLTLGTPPPMPSTSYYCSDNVTLVKDITFDVCSGAGCKQYTKLTNTFCEFGCDPKNNQCVPPPINRMGFIAVVIIGILGFIVVVRRFA